MTWLIIGLGLLAVMTLTGCGEYFDDKYVLWARYNGPGGNVWRVEEEHNSNVWRSASNSNRWQCERALAGHRTIDVKVADDFKKIGKTVGSTDYVCLPKGMHP